MILGTSFKGQQASLVAQLGKNPPEMQETWVQSLGWEDRLQKGMATHSSTLAWRISWTVLYIAYGVAKSRTQLSSFHFTLRANIWSIFVSVLHVLSKNMHFAAAGICSTKYQYAQVGIKCCSLLRAVLLVLSLVCLICSMSFFTAT